MMTQEIIEETIYKLFKQAVIKLPDDVKIALEKAYAEENSAMGRLNLKAIFDNILIAEENKIPLCQDTGLPIVFVKLGRVEVDNLMEGVSKGVEKATQKIPLRPNVVHPLTRVNTGNNIGEGIPQVDVELIEKDYVEFTVFPKGFGSENNNALKMGLPGEGIDGIKRFVVDTVIAAQGKPCPPVIVGVGIGGSSDMAMKIAKKALLEKIGTINPDKTLAKMEKEILEEINASGIGPMGLGGKTTALDVKIKSAHTHTAGLPIGVCIQCWAGRHASKRLIPK